MKEHFFTINVDNPEKGKQAIRCTGDNTELFTHHPTYRDVDHLFYFENLETRLGSFIFRQILGEEQFEKIREYVFSSGEFAIHYRPEPTEADMETFIQWEMRDVA